MNSIANFISDKKIFDLKLLFANHTMQSYALDLLILVELADSDDHGYQVFEVNLPERYIASKSPLGCAHLELQNPLVKREPHIMSFLKLERSIAVIVFEDGTVWHYNNDQAFGMMAEHQLSIPFRQVTKVVFEKEKGTICLENESGERIFYNYEDGSWAHMLLDVPSKY